MKRPREHLALTSQMIPGGAQDQAAEGEQHPNGPHGCLRRGQRALGELGPLPTVVLGSQEGAPPRKPPLAGIGAACLGWGRCREGGGVGVEGEWG